MNKSLAGAVIVLCLVLTDAAAANPLKSLYTTLELGKCRRVKTDARAWLCTGLDGYPVYVAERGDRTFVSVGRDPDRRLAATQSLAVPNSLFKGNGKRATLEWRIVRRQGRPIPFATIQRYYTGPGPASGEVLVVTRVTETEDCHVAHVDALANPDAIAIARRIADREARTFDCKSGPRKVGGESSPL
jgi:hypothetical protein